MDKVSSPATTDIIAKNFKIKNCPDLQKYSRLTEYHLFPVALLKNTTVTD